MKFNVKCPSAAELEKVLQDYFDIGEGEDFAEDPTEFIREFLKDYFADNLIVEYI